MSDDFLESIESIVSSLTHKGRKDVYDGEKEYLKIPAPNVIEFVASPQYLNSPSIYRYKRSYQVLRDFFQLRCPICNSSKPEDIDCWGKSRESLESESLLIWNTTQKDDVCPKCGITRRELLTDKIIDRYNQLHLVTGMRSFSENCLVYLNLGLITGREIIEKILAQTDIRCRPYEINLEVVGEKSREPASHIIYEGEKPSRIIETKLGFIHEISPIHPMRVLRPDFSREWIQGQDLKIGDVLMVKKGADIWGTNVVPLKTARLLGYLIANGSVASQSISFTSGIEQLVVDSLNCIREQFSTNANSYYHYKNKKAWEWRVNNQTVEKELRNSGVGEWKSKTKEVPISIRMAVKEVVCEFLRGYMSCDGWIAKLSGGKGRNKIKYFKYQVGFDTVSRKLADQIRLLMLNMGILTSLSKTKSRGFHSNKKFDHDIYMVRINPEFIELFSQLIGFIDDEKQKTLKEFVEIIKGKTIHQNYGTIPGTALTIRKYLKQIDIGEGCKLDNKGHVYQNSITVSLIGKEVYDTCVSMAWYSESKSASREVVKIVVEATREYGKRHAPELLERLENFLDDSWVYVPITSIKTSKCRMIDLHVPGSHSFVANGFLNHNSGKTVTSALVGAYLEHTLITLALNQPDEKLSAYFDLKPPFEVTFIASTEVQSNDTIWAHYRNARYDSPWFKRYVAWIKQKEKDQEVPAGMEGWKYQETIKEIENGHLSVKFNSKNSNSAGLAGRTRIGSFVDELSRFRQTESSMSAEEAYRVMENSLRTIRSMVLNRDLINWLGIMASVSSPISVDDKSMELLYQSTKIKSMYAMHYATWDFNPDEKREYYDEAYEKDPVGTERDFGAKPPLAANPLVIDPEKFKQRAIDPDLKPTAKLEIIPFIDKTGQRYHRAHMVECQLRRDAPRYVCYDAGQNFDSFAGACGHIEIKELPDGNQEFITVVDWVLKILPSDNMDVWFDSCVDIIDFQLKHQKIVQVEFDRWNSITLIQQIRNLGVRAEQKSIKVPDYVKFVADSIMGRVKLLPPEPGDDDLEPPFKSPAATGIYELTKLERAIDDRRVYNAKKGKRRGYDSDDVAVTLVHLHKMIQDSQIMPTGAKIRSRDARLKREEVSSQQYQISNMGNIFSPGRSGIKNAIGRRW